MVGGIVGRGEGSTVTSSLVQANSIDGFSGVGGLMGYSISSDISSSVVQANSIIGRTNVGGLVGSAGGDRGATITSSLAQVKQLRGGSYVGGLIGDALQSTIKSSASHIQSIVAIAPTSGGAGGLVGRANVLTLSSSYVVSNIISAYSDIGGLIGRRVIYPDLTPSPVIVTQDPWDSYWDTSVLSAETANTIDSSVLGKSSSMLETSTTSAGNVPDYYVSWLNAYCNPITGAYTELRLGDIIPAGFQRAWHLGTNFQYPTPTCLPITLHQQLAALDDVINGINPVPLQ